MPADQHIIHSRWASENEIKSSLYRVSLDGGNPGCGGIPLFSEPGAVYVESTDTHSLVIGSTGSKKTRLIGMPALYLYVRGGESFVATDPKAELYEKMLPLLKEQGYRVFVLNLRDTKRSNAWNPFIVPYDLYHGEQRDKAVELLNDMAACIMKDGCSDRDPYWHNSSSDVFAGLSLLMFECSQKSEVNFRSLRALRTQAFRNVRDNVPFIREFFLRHINADSFINSLLGGTTDVCDTTRGCIVSTFDQAMRPFFSQDSLVDMLSASDLDMREIGREKTAVFLIIPDENTLYHRLVSVFVKQCYAELVLEAQRQPSKSLPRRVNFLLDEFSSLPQISDFPTMITASRSRNIRFNLIVQSINQIRDQYGMQAETIRGNCENWVFLHSREHSLLDELVSLAGMRSSAEPLVSVSMLQTLDKDKGEVFVIHKRRHPFISSLPDIDSYPAIATNVGQAEYPENSCRAEAVFDFERFCRTNSDIFLSMLFSGKTMEEIRSASSGETKRHCMPDDDNEPVFAPAAGK